MKSTARLRSFAIVTLLTTQPLIVLAQPTSAALESARVELRQAVQEGKVAGAIHLVVRDGKTIYSEVAGVADIDEKTPLRLDSILRIYSMTKPITSVAALQLYEKGKFALDDPLAKFIPAFAGATVLQTTGEATEQVAPKRAISIRDVLRHTTGYSYGDEASVRPLNESRRMRYWGPEEMYPPRMTIAQAAEALARIPTLHHPGEKFTYGFSADLLGRLIEVWSGLSLDAYLQQHVFAPLEMVDTGFSVPKEKRVRFVSCHTLRDGKVVVIDKREASLFNEGFEFLSGGGGLLSTVADYANFCQMLLDGGVFKGRRVLKTDTVQLIFTDQLNGIAGEFRFGFGFDLGDVEIGSGLGLRKVAKYSWGGYASTDFQIVPREKLIQIYARQQVPMAGELAKKQFAVVNGGLSAKE